VRLVHLGRPWASLERFDLIITTPQYQLPERPNVLHNVAPLHRVTAERLREAGAIWEPRLAELPRPYTAVLVGGNSGDFNCDPPTAARLGRAASARVRRTGGALLITTSARTPTGSTEALEAAIDVPAHLFRWTPQAADNPYLGYLALADAFIVTADSVSMVTEACVTRKPVYIFDPVEMPRFQRCDETTRNPRVAWPALRFRNAVQWLSMRVGPRRLRRDVKAVHQRLIAERRAAWLGDELPDGVRPPLADVERAVRRVRALFDFT
jgi:mitochondrial fission protein ELM1